MRKHLNLIIMLVMAALVAGAVYFIVPPGEKTHLGLDLQGGLQVVYQAKTSSGGTPTDAEMEKTVGVLDRRVNGMGVTESQIQRQGTDEISVSLPGIKDPQEALNKIGKTAQLEFFKDDSDSRPVGPVESKKAALKELRNQGVSKSEIAKLADEGATTKYSLVHAAAGTAGNTSEQWFVYKRPPAMTGDAVKSASSGYNSSTNKPNVSINFTDAGSKTFQEITRELYRSGLLKQEAQTFAIVFDNEMISDPMIDYTDSDLSDGISGSAEISGGNMTTTEAKDLAFYLNLGALPVKLEVAYQQEVSATLGSDSLRQGLIAGLVGLIIVLIYMLVYYRFLGLVADLALIVYGVLLWGLFNLIPVTLTLPGIAGMILTIGVAADANVVIFERIKEEVRRGKTVRSAVNSGYGRGFKTILDANILTILTALVIFYFASAQPKGFALTLMLGTIVSMLTAVLFTRAMLAVLAGFSFFNRPAFMGVKPGQVDIETATFGETRATASRRRRAAKGDKAGGETVDEAGEEVAAEMGEEEPAAKKAAAKKAAQTQTRPKQPRSGSGGGRRTSTSRKRKKRR